MQFFRPSWLKRKENQYTRRNINNRECDNGIQNDNDINFDTTPFLYLENITYGYVSHKSIIENVTMQIPRGRFVGLLGPSGSGKSTLIKIIAGLYKPWVGSVRYNFSKLAYACGEIDGRNERKKFANENENSIEDNHESNQVSHPYSYPSPQGNNTEQIVMGYVPQIETVDWNFPVTVKEVVGMGIWDRSGISPFVSGNAAIEIDKVLDDLGIISHEFGKRQIRELSGGEQQRVFLARALVRKPSFLILDEPTSGVDYNTREKILKMLTSLSKGGLTIIIATHDLPGIARRLPWVVCMNKTIIAEGPPSEVLTNANLLKTYGLVENKEDGNSNGIGDEIAR
ncbi:MAG: metal ABC transporter ATP-binding protein [Nitrososphaeraceae archaeon]